MKRTRIVSLLISVAIFFPSAAAIAQLNRTAVSINGSDANACSPASPCRSFAHAITQTNPGGELIALDSGGYGAFTVDRSMTVLAAPGVYAGVTAASGDGVDVNAGATDRVIIRNLVLNGLGSGSQGIALNSGAELHIENCQVSGFTGMGVGSYAPASLFVSDTVVRNTNAAYFFYLNSGSASVVIERCQALDSNDGFTARQFTTVVVRDSLATGNHTGYKAYGISGVATLFVENCIVANNVDGILGLSLTGGSTKMWVSNSMIVNNTGSAATVGCAGCEIVSFGNNRIRGNGANAGFTSTVSQN